MVGRRLQHGGFKIVLAFAIALSLLFSLSGCATWDDFIAWLQAGNLSFSIPAADNSSTQTTTTTTTPNIIQQTPNPTGKPDPAQFAAIDEHSRNTPAEAEKTVESLTDYLVKSAKNDVEKTRAIWIWITAHITYDVKGFFSGTISTYDANSAFSKRIAVCSGYSELFKKMADRAGLTCEVISGFAKGYGYQPVYQTMPSANHAWNAVKIGDEWKLLDSTWGAGYTDSSKQFVRRYEEFYFFTPPSQFIYDHYPEERQWQLLQQPIEPQDFLAFPQTWPEFFTCGLKPVSHPNGRIEITSRELTVEMGVADDSIKLLAAIYSSSGQMLPKSSVTVVKTTGNSPGFLINCTFPGPGTYTLAIFAGRFGDKQFDIALEYLVAVK